MDGSLAHNSLYRSLSDMKKNFGKYTLFSRLLFNFAVKFAGKTETSPVKKLINNI